MAGISEAGKYLGRRCKISIAGTPTFIGVPVAVGEDGMVFIRLSDDETVCLERGCSATISLLEEGDGGMESHRTFADIIRKHLGQTPPDGSAGDGYDPRCWSDIVPPWCR